MVVRKPSVGKRVMARMPDWPAVSFAQLSSLPTPSALTTPIPVTATMGRPALSRLPMMLPSTDPLDQSQSFAAPIADAGDDHLRQAGGTIAGIAAAGRRKQLAVLERGAGDPQIGRKLGLDPMPDIRTGVANGKAEFLERAAFRRGRGLYPAGAGNDGGVGAIDLAGDGFPLPAQRGLGLAGRPQIAVGMDFGKPRPRFGAARLRMFGAFQHQKRAHGRKGNAAVGPAVPNRSEFFLQQHVAELERQQHVPA